MKNLTISFLLMVTNLYLPAQEWIKSYDLGLHEGGYKITATTDGNFLITGKEWGLPNLRSKHQFTKVDINGNIQWHRSFFFGQGGSSYEKSYTFCLPENKGYFIIGASYGIVSPSSYSDIYLFHISEQGDSLWSKTIGTEAIENLYAVTSTKDPNVFALCYYYNDLVTKKINTHFVKVNTEGETLLDKSIELTHPIVLYSLVQSPDGNFISSGYLSENQNSDAFIMKISQDGDFIWHKRYGGEKADYFYDLEINKNGNPVFFGNSNSFSPKGIYIVETDWNGNLQKENVIPAPNGGVLSFPHPRIEVLKLSNQGFVILADKGFGSTSASNDPTLYWLDSNANLIVDQTFGDDKIDEFVYDAVQLKDNSLLIVGDFVKDESDLMIIKLKSEFISSTSSVKKDDIDINPFPNPFTNEILLAFPPQIELPVLVELYNSSGQLQFSQKVMEFRKNINVSSLNSGVYTLLIRSESTQAVFKVVKM